jgi:hypothetical protein
MVLCRPAGGKLLAAEAGARTDNGFVNADAAETDGPQQPARADDELSAARLADGHERRKLRRP